MAEPFNVPSDRKNVGAAIASIPALMRQFVAIGHFGYAERKCVTIGVLVWNVFMIRSAPYSSLQTQCVMA